MYRNSNSSRRHSTRMLWQILYKEKQETSPVHTCNLEQASANRAHIATPAGTICSMHTSHHSTSNSQPTPAMGRPQQMAQMLQGSSSCILLLPFHFPALATHWVLQEWESCMIPDPACTPVGSALTQLEGGAEPHLGIDRKARAAVPETPPAGLHTPAELFCENC